MVTARTATALLISAAFAATSAPAAHAAKAQFSGGLCAGTIELTVNAGTGYWEAYGQANCLGSTKRRLYVQTTPGTTGSFDGAFRNGQWWFAKRLRGGPLAKGQSMTACALLTTPEGYWITGTCVSDWRPKDGTWA